LAIQDLQDLQDSQARLDRPALQEQIQLFQDRKDLLVHRVCRVHKVQKEIKETPVILDHRDQQDLRDQ
jgi:ssDNA-binding replication factor A large subunit